MHFLKNRIMPFTALLLFAFITIGCGHAAKAPITVAASSADDLIANRIALLTEARKVTPEISVEELNKMIEAGENITVIDVRDPNEWEVGVIDFAGTKTISRGLLEFRAPAQVDVNERIYVICKSGARGIFASKALIDLGYPSVTNVVGGMDAWMAEGYPVK
ncbi:Rhodanese domain protein [Desulfurispirillum indicum S5]|uniref:Rhodanese domain protein n=1 Tax=Desulfurispirillum indicum (strain ATCC BAA-1389 / DSM 22839 / S5) TaxID=653733 RepID=E6W6I2_DESIS|nr:rhodanese-like domain-containing protein [Desulfurispirillum indicum]ADU67317.1 Rhodanese domain protein [Desulfurispirillum indicum S5]